MKMIRTTSLIAAALLGSITMTSAQQLSLMLGEGDNKDEYKSGSTIYLTKSKQTEEGGEFTLHSYIKPAEALIGTEVDVIVKKASHKGNADWGVGQICMGTCSQANSFGDVYNSTANFGKGVRLDKYEKQGDESFTYWTNAMDIHHLFKGKLFDKFDQYKVNYAIVKHGTEQALGTFDVVIMYQFPASNAKVAENAIDQVMMISEPGGACTLQYAGEGRNLTLEVYDMAGNLAFRTPLPAGNASYRLPVLLPEGVKIFRLVEEGKPVFTQKYLVK